MSVIPPKIFDEPPPPSDGRAAAEALDISSGTLRRDESFRTHKHIAGLIIFWFFIATVLTTAGVWLFNILTPQSWHFLDATEKTQLQNLIIAGLSSSLATDLGKRLLNK